MITKSDYDNLETKLRELEATVSMFTFGSKKEVAGALRHLRSGPHGHGDVADGMSPQEQRGRSSRSSSDGVQEIWDSVIDGGSPSIPPSFTSNFASVDSGYNSDLELYHEDRFPCEKDVRSSIAAFENGPAKLFFVMTPADSQDLLYHFYGAGSRGANKLDICLLCGFAAFGASFVPDIIPGRTKESLFRTALLLINECYEAGGLQGLRALVCLALSSFVDKRKSIRVTLASALEVARWTRLSGKLSTDQTETFRKLYRSMIVLDSYLATKYPYFSTVSPDEVHFAAVSSPLDASSRAENSFSLHMNSLALLSGSIAADVKNEDRYSVGCIDGWMDQLDAWHQTLPDDMRLNMLTSPSENDRPYEMQIPILLLHEAFLSIVLFLHRGLLPSILEQRAVDDWRLNQSSGSTNECYCRTVMVARQNIRVNNLLATNAPEIFRQCWLLLCELFICSCILLADTALSISSGSKEGAGENLDRVEEAMETMKHMRRADELDADLQTELTPLSRELRSIYEAMGKASEMKGPESGARPLLQLCVRLLKTINQLPFKQALANALSSTEKEPPAREASPFLPGT